MKVLYVCDQLAHWGGVERIFVDKTKRLVSMFGCDVYILTTDQGDHPLSFQLHPAVHYTDLGVRYHLQYRYRGLRRYWEKWQRYRLLQQRFVEKMAKIQPDVIVSTTSFLTPLLNKIRRRIPLVVESHCGYEATIDEGSGRWWKRIALWYQLRELSKTDVLVTLTEHDAAKWRHVHPCVKVIPNVVHMNESNTYSTLDEKRIIFVGRFALQKAIPDLLAVWRLVHERHPDWRLDMYGEGELKKALTIEVAAMNANIYVHEPVADILSKYRESSLLVLSSLYEPFGLVIPEAMSCGLPVVSFEGDGPNSIITDGKDGFLIKNRDIGDFADRVCQLIENQELRQRLGQAAIQSAQRYSAENIMPMWKELFESLKK